MDIKDQIGIMQAYIDGELILKAEFLNGTKDFEVIFIGDKGSNYVFNWDCFRYFLLSEVKHYPFFEHEVLRRKDCLFKRKGSKKILQLHSMVKYFSSVDIKKIHYNFVEINFLQEYFYTPEEMVENLEYKYRKENSPWLPCGNPEWRYG